MTSHASIVAPFLLGALLALRLYPRYSDSGVTFAEFALFMGAAMSVTAFPVLARILTERNLLSTKVGAVTIACAAVDDVTAWCLLAGVVALSRAHEAGGALAGIVLGSALYVVFMLKVARPLLGRVEAYYHSRGRLTQDVVALLVLAILASAWLTEWLGIHALFGAFLLGAVLPKARDFVRDVAERFEDVTVVLFLPLFFAYTGLRTRIGVLDDASLWLDCALVIFVAVLGKLGGSSIAARLSGLSWREAGALGVLMNTRGLMELVILSIGLDLGVISPAVFVMMVLMALVTTFMTTPLLEWIYPERLIRQEAIGGAEGARDDAILIPIALPSSGPELLQVARELGATKDGRIYALHLRRPDDHALPETGAELRPGDHDALRPILDAAGPGSSVRPLAFTSVSIGEDICDVARVKGARLVLLGWHKPVLSESILGGAVSRVMDDAPADVAVYVARRAPPWARVLVPFARGPHDLAALELARRIAANGKSEITVLHVVPPGRTAPSSSPSLADVLKPMGPDRVSLKVVESDDPEQAVVDEAARGHDLILIGATPDWGLEPRLFSRRHERLAQSFPGSLLIVRKRPPVAGAAARISSASGRVARPPTVHP